MMITTVGFVFLLATSCILAITIHVTDIGINHLDPSPNVRKPEESPPVRRSHYQLHRLTAQASRASQPNGSTGGGNFAVPSQRASIARSITQYWRESGGDQGLGE